MRRLEAPPEHTKLDWKFYFCALSLKGVTQTGGGPVSSPCRLVVSSRVVSVECRAREHWCPNTHVSSGGAQEKRRTALVYGKTFYERKLHLSDRRHGNDSRENSGKFHYWRGSSCLRERWTRCSGFRVETKHLKPSEISLLLFELLHGFYSQRRAGKIRFCYAVLIKLFIYFG